MVVEQCELEKHSAKTPMQFDGRLVHGTEQIRNSLVFFTVRGAAAASRQVQCDLVRDGALSDAWRVQGA